MYADQHRKRVREEEDENSSGVPVGFTEHRSKRLQSLPLRTSPHSKRWSDRPNLPLPNPNPAVASQAQTVTPEEATPDQHMWADEPELVSGGPLSAMALDTEMDMTGTSDLVAARGEPGDPGPLHGGETAPSVTGRIPTPIHCSFAAQVRGSSWNGGGVLRGDALATTPEEPNAAAFSANSLVEISQPSSAVAAAAAQFMADWSMVQTRRLPSPISDCGVEDSQGSGNMALDSGPVPGGGGGEAVGVGGGPLSHLTHEHPLLAGLPPRSSSAMGARSVREDTPGSDGQGGNAMDIESPSGPAAPSPRKGHTRSKHTLNSWTALQPGMKRSFSIGYRADCEKCRMKVPGHFNHIIIS